MWRAARVSPGPGASCAPNDRGYYLAADSHPEEFVECGTSCVGSGPPVDGMEYVGFERGKYIQELTYQFVGSGGDFGVVQPERKDFTCHLTCCCCGLMLLMPFLIWLLYTPDTTTLFPCSLRLESQWSKQERAYCCVSLGKGCPARSSSRIRAVPSAKPVFPPVPPLAKPVFPPVPPLAKPVFSPVPPLAKPVLPPMPPPAKPAPSRVPPPPPLPPTHPPTPGRHSDGRHSDPFNCALGIESSWPPAKKEWCCEVHHKACPPPRRPALKPPASPLQGNTTAPLVSPLQGNETFAEYDCNLGFAKWTTGWPAKKKAWCCKVASKGCLADHNSTITRAENNSPTTSLPTASLSFDCTGGFSKWKHAWSVAKKAWCCQHQAKGCVLINDTALGIASR